MAKVHVCNVLVLDNPAKFMTKLEFEITFECIEDLPEDLEWKIIYVGSAESEEFDQILDTVYVSQITTKTIVTFMNSKMLSAGKFSCLNFYTFFTRLVLCRKEGTNLSLLQIRQIRKKFQCPIL